MFSVKVEPKEIFAPSMSRQNFRRHNRNPKGQYRQNERVYQSKYERNYKIKQEGNKRRLDSSQGPSPKKYRKYYSATLTDAPGYHAFNFQGQASVNNVPYNYNFSYPPPTFYQPSPLKVEQPLVSSNVNRIDNLLSLIEKSGILFKTLTAESATTIKTSTVPPHLQTSLIKEKKCDRADLNELFSAATLSLWNDDVDVDLSDPKEYCWKCGIQVDDVKSLSFRQHMDEHISLELGKSRAHYQRTRPMYQNKEDFINHGQDLQVSSSSTANAVNSSTLSLKKTKFSLDNKVVSADQKSRVCAACNEPFQEIFDDDLDEWIIKDGIIINSKTYHKSCIN